MKKGPTVLIVIIIIAFAAVLLWRVGVIKIGGEKVGGPGPEKSRLNRPVNVGIVTWGGYAGGIMANNGFKANKNCDFYRNHGIQVDLKVIDDFVQSRSAFKAGGKGGIDIVWATVDAYALEYPALKELNPVCIMQYDWSRGGDAIAVDGNVIRTARDLEGKTISVAEDTPSHYFALFVIEEAGLRATDIKWRFTNSAIDAANVFKAGRVDATVSWSPDVYIAARERNGGKILMSTREATHLIADIFVARGDFASEYPEVVEKFVAGWLEGVDKVHQQLERKEQDLSYMMPIVKLMADGFGLSMEDSEAMLGDVYLPNYADNMYFFDSVGNPVSYDAVFEKSSSLWKELGKIDTVYTAKESRQTRFLLNLANRFEGEIPKDPTRDPSSFATVLSPGEGADIITKNVNIYFDTGSAELDANARVVVKSEIAQFVATYGNCFVSIEGNTDNTGSYGVNKRLSLQRAESVKKYLIEQYNMEPARFSVKGNAWDIPVAPNTTADGRAQNRRTDIVIKSRTE